MSRNLMVLFLLVAIICVTVMSNPPPELCKPLPPPPPKKYKLTPAPPPPPPKCRKDEVYKICGSACQPTCKNPNPICKKVCVEGCFCKDGLLRNKGLKCVKPCDC
ncbi:cysteine-rich venom protein 6-like [Cataglyphis hispanica]|uniref:cysteine-rich venom protein 6-like n=1 Tax=Cataglyphis hispanica TaxID=1086592 RepID=UPI00217FA0B5|nr:cysteine-rich venom protein 6-like [Cataglyphis hispanica]